MSAYSRKETNSGKPPSKKCKLSPSDSTSVATPPKKQTTITSFFQVGENSKPKKLEFVDDRAKKMPSRFKQTTNTESTMVTENTVPPEIEMETQGKKCPYYKRIPDSSFVVDAFSYGSIPGVKHYFLSHFHYDHYYGLTKRFSNRIYCTQITANLVTLKLGVSSKYLKVLALKEPFVVDGVIVELFEANHCPGSAMFLFQFPNGKRILHTGDFCATPNMPVECGFFGIDSIYLDTTYLDPFYCFPPQDHVIQYSVNLVQTKLRTHPKTLIICGSYTIGKERLFQAIASMFNLCVWAAAHKRKILHCLEDSFLNSCLVTDWKKAQIHVLSMNQLTLPELQRHLSNFEGTFNEVVAFRPTGWTCKQSTSKNIESITPRRSGCISLYEVPYSEHSSFTELKKFVQTIRPQKVIPTVNSGSKFREMNMVIKEWLK